MTTRQRRLREKRRRREDILGAARRLFWKRGYLGTTMPGIADACELAPGTLYLYFPSKGALYAELLLEGYDRLMARLEDVLDEAAPARAQAEALIDAFLAFARDQAEYFEVIFFVLQREAGGPRGGALEPEQVERLRLKEDACKALVAGVLERAGYARSAGRQEATVDAIWSMLAGVTFYFGKREAETFDAVAAEAKALLLDAVFDGR